MKNNVMPSFVQIEGEELQKLVAEVKETVANHVGNENSTANTNTLSAADLWSIQKSMKPALRTKLTKRWGM